MGYAVYAFSTFKVLTNQSNYDTIRFVFAFETYYILTSMLLTVCMYLVCKFSGGMAS